ncbi:MAG: ATP-binding protein [Thermoanaerobaculia bacterium]|nr:ATP-binding protein [Thermoanaerobaculia bacterium]
MSRGEPEEVERLRAELAELRARLAQAEEAGRRWRETESELRQSRRMLQLVLDTIPVRVFWKDRDSIFLGGNLPLVRDCGFDDPADLIGRSDYETASAETAELYRADDRQVIESGEPKLNYVEPQVKPDGSAAWLNTSKVPLRDDEGRVIGILGTYEDITERRQLEAQLLRAQKLESLGLFAGGLAHDFSNLLAALLGHAELAEAALPAGAPALVHLRRIEGVASQAAELCRQLLAYAGRGELAAEPVDLSALMRESAEMLAVSIPAAASVRQELVDGLPEVMADRSQLRQVVLNLIRNAADAIGEEGGEIVLATAAARCERGELAGTVVDDGLPEGEYVALEVRDTGCGMPAEVQRRVFDPFFTTKRTGRGLGMPSVLGIVRRHRGAIRLESEPGRGTTVRVLLPAGPREGRPQEVASGGAAAAAGIAPAAGTVLVIDDDENVRPVTRMLLEQLGYGVLVAAGGREGLALFAAHRDRVACVLLDLSMPDLGGEATFRELRALDPAVRVVLASGYGAAEAREQFAGLGLAGFVRKPYGLAELEAALAAALGR